MRKRGILLSLALLAMLSCIPKETPETPINKADWHNVSHSESTLSLDGITVHFPAGTFSGNTQVALTPLSAGSVAGAMEKSSFYRVSLKKGGTNGPFEIRIPWSGDQADVQAVLRQKTVSFHTGGSEESLCPIEYSFEGKNVVVSIPQLYEHDGQAPYFAVGLIENTGESQTKATNPTVLYLNTMPWAQREPAGKILNQVVPDAFDDLRLLNFNPDFSWVGMIIKKLDGEEGLADIRLTFFDRSLGYMVINSEALDRIIGLAHMPTHQKPLIEDLERTLVHEMFHLIHSQLYDMRSGANQLFMGSVGDEWGAFSEAVGTWTEKIVGVKEVGANAIERVNALYDRLMPFSSGGDDDYITLGYSHALFIEYLSRQTSDRQIVELLEYQKEGAKNLYEVYEKFTKAHNIDFFSEFNSGGEWYRFIFSLMNGSFDPRITPNEARLHKLGTRVDLDAFGEETVTGFVDNYGTSRACVYVSKESFQKMKDYDLVVKQESPDLVTHLYYQQNNQLYPMGDAVAGAPAVVSAETLKNVQALYHKDADIPALVLITVKQKQGKAWDVSASASKMIVSFAMKSDIAFKIQNIDLNAHLHRSEGEDVYNADFFANWYNGIATVEVIHQGIVFTIKGESAPGDPYQRKLEAKFNEDGDKLGTLRYVSYSLTYNDPDGPYDQTLLFTAIPSPAYPPQHNTYSDIWTVPVSEMTVEYSASEYSYPKTHHFTYAYVSGDYIRLKVEYQ